MTRFEMSTPLSVKSIKCIADERALLGEGPIWDPRLSKLLWVDIKGNALFVTDPATEQTRRYEAPDMISALGLADHGGYVCVNRFGFFRLWTEADELRLEAISDPESDRAENRFNDGKVDPDGGFWAGTMDDREEEVSGAWWRLGAGSVSKLAGDFKVTNGPAFDLQNGRVYVTDSAAQTIYMASYDEGAMGALSVFRQFGERDGYPDGMEVDRFGALWVAFWDGGEVRRFSPEGALLDRVTVPVPRPTSIAIVENRLFVTSARIGLEEPDLAQYPLSGGLFAIEFDHALAVEERLYFQSDLSIVG